MGGSGSPANASPSEQDYRALILYRKRGWSPWICAALAGLKEDSSAKSGKIPSRAESAYMESGKSTFSPPNTSACRVGSTTAPAWGGEVFKEGNTYRDMICFQRQLGHLGYGLEGSGYFGKNTLAALHKFQSNKHLKVTNTVDMTTWVAAWGKSGGVKAGVKTTPTKPTVPAKPTTPSKPTKPTTPSKPSKPVTSGDDATYPGISAGLCHVGAAKAPNWPRFSWSLGDTSGALGCWQMQMAHRGYTDLHGNGYYGNNTLKAAKSIQNANHLGGSGLIGPATWKAAWEGKVNA